MRTFGQYLSTNDVSIYESLTKTSEEMSRALANWTQNFILSAISAEDRIRVENALDPKKGGILLPTPSIIDSILSKYKIVWIKDAEQSPYIYKLKVGDKIGTFEFKIITTPT